MGVVGGIVDDVRLVLLRIVRDVQTYLVGYSFRPTPVPNCMAAVY